MKKLVVEFFNTRDKKKPVPVDAESISRDWFNKYIRPNMCISRIENANKAGDRTWCMRMKPLHLDSSISELIPENTDIDFNDVFKNINSRINEYLSEKCPEIGTYDMMIRDISLTETEKYWVFNVTRAVRGVEVVILFKYKYDEVIKKCREDYNDN